MSVLGERVAPPHRDGNPPVPTTRAHGRAWSRVRPELAGLLALAAVLNLWNLSVNGWANDYYAAAVRSMASSWHAFLYGSFDVAGVMTVDKPPLSLWVQALSVRAFGYHPLAILIPQALMGMATVALAYDLTRRRFGRVAGTVAGLVLALTPITVAISRHNNPDALVALCSVGALWCIVRGLEDGRTRWLVWAGVCVGLGFEAKMGAALLVVPALAAAWLWVAPRGRAAAARALAAGGAAMVVVGGAWPALMALTPAADRPWISGTSDNSILSLILDYNGVGRLDGQLGGPQGFGGAGGGGLFGGSSGPLRLLNEALGGQAGWLLGFALVAGVAVLVATHLRRGDPRTGWLIAAGGSFATIAIAFSAAKGIFHPYYVSLLAPFTATLAGAGMAELAERGLVAAILAPLAVAAGVLVEVKVLHDNTGSLSWLPPLLLVGGITGAAALANLTRPRARLAALAATVALLLVAPATWAAQTLGHATNGTFPAGGPTASGFGFGGGGGFAGGGGGPFGGSDGIAQATAYATAHGGGTVVVSSQTSAAASIISDGADVAGIGGFSGRESAVSVAWLDQAIRDGRIRWVLTTGGQGFGAGNDGRTGSTTAMAAVQRSCTPVTTVSGLYDCAAGQNG
jgi:4-amino-4-deoxy-L-arabinose transferase-like glycosyltransferase